MCVCVCVCVCVGVGVCVLSACVFGFEHVFIHHVLFVWLNIQYIMYICRSTKNGSKRV